MPYEISTQTRGVYVRFFGVVTGHDIAGAAEEVGQLPDFDDLRFGIAEFTAATVGDISDDDVSQAAAQLIGARYTNPNFLIAIVATSKDLLTPLRRQLALFKFPDEPRIFDSVEGAVDWIAGQTNSIRRFSPRT